MCAAICCGRMCQGLIFPGQLRCLFHIKQSLCPLLRHCLISCRAKCSSRAFRHRGKRARRSLQQTQSRAHGTGSKARLKYRRRKHRPTRFSLILWNVPPRIINFAAPDQFMSSVL